RGLGGSEDLPVAPADAVRLVTVAQLLEDVERCGGLAETGSARPQHGIAGLDQRHRLAPCINDIHVASSVCVALTATVILPILGRRMTARRCRVGHRFGLAP